MKALRTIRHIAWAAVAILIGVVGTTLLHWRAHYDEKPDAAPASAAPFGRPFAMVDHTGKTVTDRDFAGRPLAVFFGFTHCPDVCPTTLAWLTGLVEEIGPEAKDLAILFVTVDPERDTPAALADYIANFAPNAIALTGSPEQVAATIATWKAYAKKVPLDGGGYTMDHTASIYLIDRQGRFRGTLDLHDETPGANVSKLARLVRGT